MRITLNYLIRSEMDWKVVHTSADTITITKGNKTVHRTLKPLT